MPSTITIEAVCCSVEDVVVATRAGASRVELCSAIDLGGLTPSVGLVRRALIACTLPAVAMVRPRTAGFHYSTSEIDTMRADAQELFAAGIRGIVFAALKADRTIDREACLALLEVCPAGVQSVFHRAFDATPDLDESLDTLIDLGFTRVLTSGGANTALSGIEDLARLVERARGRIEILPAGGVRALNAVEILRGSGATQLHLGPMVEVEDSTSPFYGAAFRSLDEEALKAVVMAASY